MKARLLFLLFEKLYEITDVPFGGFAKPFILTCIHRLFERWGRSREKKFRVIDFCVIRSRSASANSVCGNYKKVIAITFMKIYTVQNPDVVEYRLIPDTGILYLF